VFARQEVHECAEVDDAYHLAFVDRTDLRFRGDFLDAGNRRFQALAVFTEDFDGAVVFDVDGSTGFFGDGADGRTALADHVADLVRMDLQGRVARSILVHHFTGSTNHFVHFRENVQASLQGLLEGSLHDLFGNAFDLDVHLQRGHTRSG